MPRRRSAAAVLALLALAAAARADDRKPVEYNRDIRPILSDNCFVCHGPDKNLRKADLRLDQEEAAFADRGGYRVLVPGHPAKSELYRRITAQDVKERMPPVKHRKQLTAREV